MGEAWKSLSIPDKAAMIVHFMQMKLQWDTMSEEQKDEQKAGDEREMERITNIIT